MTNLNAQLATPKAPLILEGTPKEIWGQKVASHADLRAVRDACWVSIGDYWSSRDLVVHGSSVGSGVQHWNASWWIEREVIREIKGVYPEPTEALRWLRHAGGMCGALFPHVSPEDPTMIAYTADRQGGENDRQVRTTMGRFVRKYLPLLSDAEVAAIEESHRAELDPTFDVAQTQAEIERVYTSMVGDSACMRYPRSHFSALNNVAHPSAVYEYPGLSVAYLKDSGGNVTARSVIYENPDNPLDKRYVRNYGAPHLKTKLERAGFRCAGLAGVRLKAIHVPGFEGRYVMPYIDQPGGPGSGNSDRQAIGCVKYEGQDFITLLDRDHARDLEQEGFASYPIQSTSAYTVIHTEPVAPGSPAVCHFSGMGYAHGETPTLLFINSDFVVGRAIADEILSARLDGSMSTAQVVHAGRLVDVMLLASDREKLCLTGVFSHLVNTDETLENHRLRRLSPTYYPGRQAAPANSTVCLGPSETVYIKKEDAIKVIGGSTDGGNEWQHKSKVRDLIKAGFVKLAPYAKQTLLAHKDDPHLVTTVSGRKAHGLVHDLTRLHDGRWDFSRNAEEIFFGGRAVHVNKAEWAAGTVSAQSLADAAIERLRGAIVNIVANNSQATTREKLQYEIERGLNRHGAAYYATAEGGVASFSRHYVPAGMRSLENLVLAAHRLVEAARLDRLTEMVSYVPQTRLVAHAWALYAIGLERIAKTATIELALTLALGELSAQAGTTAPPCPVAELHAQNDGFALAS